MGNGREPVLTKILNVRLSEALLSKTVAMAEMYAGGDKSEWVRHCLENYKPKVIKKGGRRKPTPRARKA